MNGAMPAILSAFTVCGLFRTPLVPAFGGSAYGLGRYSTVLTMSGRAFCASSAWPTTLSF